MKTTVDKSTFVNTFDQYGRGNNFSRAAREALFEYFEELESDLGEEIEFDCVAICCDWSEYSDAREWADDCYTSEQIIDLVRDKLEDGTIDKFEDSYGESMEAVYLDIIRENTQVIEFDGGILVQAF